MRKITFSSLAAQCGVLAVVLVAYHFLLREWMRHGMRLGAISDQLAPLYAYWRPHFKSWLIVPAGVLAAYFLFLRKTRIATSMRSGPAVACFMTWAAAIAVSVAMIDGPRAIVGPLLRSDLEYSGAIDRVDQAGSVAEFVRDYPMLAATMPMHAQVHPPGAVLFAWAGANLIGGGAWGEAAWIIGFTTLAVAAVFGWAHRVAGPGVARRAAAIFVLAPSVVLFTATSMDGPFAVFLIAAMWLFWESLEAAAPADSLMIGAVAGVAAGLAALMTYSVTVALLFCGIAGVMAWITLAERRGCIVAAAISAAAGFFGLHLVLWECVGYDPIAMFRAAIANSNAIMSGTRHEDPVRYAHLVLGNLVVFFAAAGLPCSVLWWSSLWRRLRASDDAGRRGTDATALPRFAVAAALTLLIAAAVPVYVLEVERVWMFLVPLVVIPVAARLFERESGSGKVRCTVAVAALLAAQTVLTEVLLTTYW